MKEAKFVMFQNRLARVHRHLQRVAHKQGVTCYRLYDHDLPEFPFIIEIYEEYLSVSEYKRRHGLSPEEHETWLKMSIDTISEVLKVPGEKIFLRTRQRKEGREGQYRKKEEQRREIIVREGGLKFIVNLTDYLDTGLFLDHRVTRGLVKDGAKDKRVLNLFAYTGSFSVYAAAGGASGVVTMDLSKTYIDWARRNLMLNGFESEAYSFVQADVLQFLAGEPAEKFDLIVLDPPTFSNSKRMEHLLDVQRDHVYLINRCLLRLNEGGEIYFSTNYSKFSPDLDKIAGDVRDITRQTTPFDFQGKLKRYCYLITG